MILDYWQAVLKERDWSWTLVAVLLILFGLVIRGWFLGPLIHKAKSLDRKIYHEIKSTYLKRSLAGWVFFFIATGLAVFVWSDNPKLPLGLQDKVQLAAIGLSFFLSILLHLIAFGLASLSVLQERTGDNIKIL